ncbi:MAG: GTPase [Pseudomonadota bacterium]
MRVQKDLSNRFEPSPTWGPKEHEAYRDIEAYAFETIEQAPLGFGDKERVIQVAQKTAEIVAKHYHPTAKDPWAHFSVPEALLLLNRTSAELRKALLEMVPLSRNLRLDQMVEMSRQGKRYGPYAHNAYRVVHLLWRVARFLRAPQNALLNEVRDRLVGSPVGLLSEAARTYFTCLLIQEVGRAGIDLLSGRLRHSEEEIDALRETDFSGIESSSPPYLRLMLVGQANAGKSSLINAMANDVLCQVRPTTTGTGPVEQRIYHESGVFVDVVDTPGLDGTEKNFNTCLEQLKRADAVLWVASAVQAARALDHDARARFSSAWAKETGGRTEPPMLVILTHIDQLRPAGEWAPPYDVVHPTNKKAEATHEAMNELARVLSVPIDRVVPVAIRSGDQAYNVDLVWACLAHVLSDARLAQIERLQALGNRVSFVETLHQAARGGRFVANALFS